MNEKIYKCKSETYEHIKEVSKNINIVIRELMHRGEVHDNSKFQEEELLVFANANLLKDIQYDSPEYRENLKQLEPAIQHHHAKNRHHPEHWVNGIDEMNLIDLIELVADWRAATKRNKNGNILKSIELNTQKYNISPQLRKILENTVKEIYE
jgi:hypothetical protein